MAYNGIDRSDAFFAHHGIKGQKWGIRRFQNEDGTLTELGKKRYNKITEKYKNDKGEFSARKSTKASAATALGGAATGFGLTLAGLPMVGLPVAAASGVAASIGAIKRERARRFLENTGTGDAKDISLDRRYATNFDFLGLGAIINTAYGTHREKVAERVKNELANTKMSEIKKSKEREKELAHSGILGMKWGRRRFQNPDGSFTAEGRIRYLKGGDKTIRKAEKQRERRQAILSDRKKLYKHRGEFSKAEIDKAMEKFIAEDKLKSNIDDEKEAKRQAKIEAQRSKAEYKQSKADYKKMKMQMKMNKQAEEIKREQQKQQMELQKMQSKEQQKQAKLQTEQKKMENEQKEATANSSIKAALWKNRLDKAKNVYEFAKVGRDILGDMGIVSKDGNESLFGALAESFGLKDNSAAKAAAAAKKAQEAKTAALNLMKLEQQVAQEKIKTKQAHYNFNHPNQKGGGVSQKDIDDIKDALRSMGANI